MLKITVDCLLDRDVSFDQLLKRNLGEFNFLEQLEHLEQLENNRER